MGIELELVRGVCSFEVIGSGELPKLMATPCSSLELEVVAVPGALFASTVAERGYFCIEKKYEPKLKSKNYAE